MPHGHCFLWYPTVLWLHVISDAFTALAYYSLPVALFYFARKRPDMPFRHVLILFGLFISLCGTTHLMDIWVLWHPDYGVEGLIKAATAIVSMLTAIIVWRAMPQIITAPSPQQLERMNAQLKNTYLEIEAQVALRTAELAEANARLQELTIAAEKANQAKSEFLANMSHEIRTPMNAVVGLTGILGMTKLDEKQKKYVETLQLSAESLLSLINNLLDISKIESDVLKLDCTTFDFERTLHEVLTILAVKAKDKGIALRLDFDDTLKGDFIGDESKLRQVLMNLVSNAIKFTEQGTVSVDATRTRVGSQHQTVLTVRDTGIGIPADKQQSIFGKFSQADTSITRRYGGTGLGLAITKKLVELMGGTITLTSIPGNGSVFTVTLPYLADIPQEGEEAQALEHAAHTVHNSQRALRVLLVEDHGPNVLVACAMLEQLGHEVDVAGDGQQALDRVERHDYDLVLMDMQMPVLDGYSATRELRRREQQEEKPRLPIIAVTAHAMTQDRDTCFAAGVDEYLTKPITLELLQAKIAKVMH